MFNIIIENSRRSRVACLGAVGDKLGRNFCRVAAGLFGQHALRVRLHGAPPLARECRCGAVGLHTAVIAAGAGLSAVNQIGMAQFDAVVHAAVEHFAVQDDASAKPRAECQQNARFAADKRTLIEFGQCSAVGVIGDINRDAGKLLLQESAQRNVVEIQIVRVKNRLSARVDAAGDNCTERFYAGKRRVPLFQQCKNCRTDFSPCPPPLCAEMGWMLQRSIPASRPAGRS